MRALRLLGLLFALALALPACYETPAPACAFLCGQGGACPDGYTCRADAWCRRQDVSDQTVCALPLSDAAPPDASLPDAAPIDAAPIDAATLAGS